MNNFLREMLSSTDNVSSRRVVGAFCVLIFILFLILDFFIVLSENQIKMLETVLYVGAGLLGLGIFGKVKFLNGGRGKSNETK